jgi:hypothetical protein
MIAPGRTVPRACLIASALALGHALQIANGFYDDRALLWLTISLALAIAATMMMRFLPAAVQIDESTLRWLTVAGLAWQILSTLQASPGMYVRPDADTNLFRTGVLVGAGLIAAGVARSRVLAAVWFPLFLVVQLALGVWMLRASPDPHIDVVVVHREAFEALRSGRSPYEISFKDIYGSGSGFYNPELVDEGRVKFGYPYPPLSLILSAPGDLAAGDYRYAQLVALIAAAGFIGYAGSTITSRLAAAVLLTQPRAFFVLEQGWTEPLALLMFAATIFAMLRVPAMASWAGGLLIVTKQYLVLASPLLWRYASARRGHVRFIVRAAAIAVLVTLPFMLWHPRSFIDSVLLLQTREPFRIDSLSYLSWAARNGLGAGSFLWAAGAAATALGISVLLTPNTASGFAVSFALTTFATFAFGSKAFCNYYFFVAGALCCAAVAVGADVAESAVTEAKIRKTPTPL